LVIDPPSAVVCDQNDFLGGDFTQFGVEGLVYVNFFLYYSVYHLTGVLRYSLFHFFDMHTPWEAGYFEFGFNIGFR